MSVRAGHGHEREGLEDSEGWLAGFLHPQDHCEEDLGDCALDLELQPLVPEFLVKVDSHNRHEPDEPGVNEATGQVTFTNKPFLRGGEAYA